MQLPNLVVFNIFSRRPKHMDTLKFTLFFIRIFGGYLEHFKISGYWKYIQLLYSCLTVTFFSIFLLSLQLIDAVHVICSLNIAGIAQNICITLNFAINVYKLITVSYYRRNISKMYRMCETLTVKNTESTLQKETIRQHEKLAQFLTRLFGSMVIISNMSAFTMIDTKDDRETFPFRAYRPPFLPEAFFNPVYRVLISWNSISVVVNDCTVLIILVQIGLQLILLETNLGQLGRNPRMMNRKFRKCVEHHRNIREFMRLFEQTYSGIFLAQFVASMLMFALVGFQAIIMPLEPIIIIYCLCILVQLFLVCHLANNILEKGKSIATSAYFSEWFVHSDRTFCMNLVTFITQSQRPFKLTAGGFFIISLDTFCKVLTRSYSYVALLKQVYEERE